MADATVVEFVTPLTVDRQTQRMQAARDEHLAAFAEWLRVARPTRDDAALEAEVFGATARQMAQLYGRAHGT